MNIAYITGPLIGGIIGCFTNYIAVKMLFYPRKEVCLFGHTLSFCCLIGCVVYHEPMKCQSPHGREAPAIAVETAFSNAAENAAE